MARDMMVRVWDLEFIRKPFETARKLSEIDA
jgi:hypothetical protein